MSYYNHPYYQAPHYGFATHPHPHPHSHPSPHTPPHPHHGFPPALPHFYDQYYSHPPQHAPAPTPAPQDLDSEERAALAYLHSIQARKAEVESRAAATRAKAIAEKEAAAKLEREKLVKVELARRQAAIQAALERESALQEAHRRRAAAINQAKAQALAYARAKATAYAQAKLQAQVEDRNSFVNRLEEKKRLCLEMANKENDRRVKCASACRARAQNATQSTEFKDVNSLLGALFGINIVGDAESQPEAASSTPAAAPPIATPAPATTSASAPAPATSAPAPASAEFKSTDNSTSAFPEDINHLLSQFLGLRVEPTTETTEQPSTNGVPAGLNEFLNRFGLQFEPTVSEAEKESSAAAQPASQAASTPSPSIQAESSKPKVQPTPAPTSSAPSSNESPLAALFGEYSNLPPFVRDILANVEQAFTEEGNKSAAPAAEKVEGKGKGVAEGERPCQPQTTSSQPQSSQPAKPTAETDDETLIALTQLESITSRLESLKKEFTFPSTLSFSPTPDGNDTPTLLFNRTNSGYHAQAHSLLQLLLAADNVVSGGNRDVRKKRKEIVKAVEAEIEELEAKRDGVWEQVKERRARDGDSDTEDYHHSSDSSSVDHEENHTSEIVDAQPTSAAVASEIETGYTVPTPAPAESSTPAVPSSSETAPIESSPTKSHLQSTSTESHSSTDAEPAKESTEPTTSSTDPEIAEGEAEGSNKEVKENKQESKEEDFELV